MTNAGVLDSFTFGLSKQLFGMQEAAKDTL
jgi:hypothetical protein